MTVLDSRAQPGRNALGKTEVRILDYVDREVPLGYAEPGDEVVVEYDEGVLRSLEELDDFK